MVFCLPCNIFWHQKLKWHFWWQKMFGMWYKGSIFCMLSDTDKKNQSIRLGTDPDLSPDQPVLTCDKTCRFRLSQIQINAGHYLYRSRSRVQGSWWPTGTHYEDEICKDLSKNANYTIKMFMNCRTVYLWSDLQVQVTTDPDCHRLWSAQIQIKAFERVWPVGTAPDNL